MKKKSNNLRRLLQSHRKRLSNEMDFRSKYRTELRGCWLPAHWHKTRKGKMVYVPEKHFESVYEHPEATRAISAVQEEIGHVDELLTGDAVVVLNESHGLPEERPED